MCKNFVSQKSKSWDHLNLTQLKTWPKHKWCSIVYKTQPTLFFLHWTPALITYTHLSLAELELRGKIWCFYLFIYDEGIRWYLFDKINPSKVVQTHPKFTHTWQSNSRRRVRYNYKRKDHEKQIQWPRPAFWLQVSSELQCFSNMFGTFHFGTDFSGPYKGLKFWLIHCVGPFWWDKSYGWVQWSSRSVVKIRSFSVFVRPFPSWSRNDWPRASGVLV